MGGLHELFKSRKIIFYQYERTALDNYNYEPYQDSQLRFEENVIFETLNDKKPRSIDLDRPPFSLFRYFLDGTRKPYKIGDIITLDNKFIPIVVGQIRTGCCYRDDEGKIHKHKLNKRDVLMLYDGLQEDDYKFIKDSIEKQTQRISLKVEKFRYKPGADENPTNAAIATIQNIMQGLEIELVQEMVYSNQLDTDQMLAVDGSIKFISHKFDKEIFYNVVGISKSFDPNLTGLQKKKQHIGTALAKLKFGERTPVFKVKSERDIYYGVWYLRIREFKNVRNPLEGVIKVEKVARDFELDEGLDSSVVDNISASILFERNPTCHGNDKRWANHLYPIFLTEKMIKSSFISDVYFMNIF